MSPTIHLPPPPKRHPPPPLVTPPPSTPKTHTWSSDASFPASMPFQRPFWLFWPGAASATWLLRGAGCVQENRQAMHRMQVDVQATQYQSRLHSKYSKTEGRKEQASVWWDWGCKVTAP